MKILVTGAAGYIGSILVPKLLGKKHEVVGIDNFLYNQSSLLDCCYDKRLTIINGDCRDENLISEQLKKVDAVIPLACLTGAPLCDKDPFAAKLTNFDAIQMILNLREKKQTLIFPMTNSGYGI